MSAPSSSGRVGARSAASVAILILAIASGCSALLGITPGNADTTNEAGAPGGDGSSDSGNDIPLQDGGCPSGALTVCGSVCADLGSSRANCGRCGHDCRGAECKPVEGTGTCAPITMAQGLGKPNGLAQDNAFLYLTLTDANMVLRVGKTDNVQTPLDGTATGAGPIVAELDANGAASYIVWGESSTAVPSKGAIRRCDLPGGTPPCATSLSKVVASEVRALALTDTRIVGVHRDNFGGTDPPWSMGIGACQKPECPQWGGNQNGTYQDEVEYSASIASSITGGLFFERVTPNGVQSPAALLRIPPGAAPNSQPITMLLNPQGPVALLVDGTTLFVGLNKGNAILKCDVTSCDDAGAGSFALSPRTLATDGTNLYWTSDSGTIEWCPRDGCTTSPPKVLARDQFSPRGIVVDKEFVYWTNAIANGQIMKVALP